MRDSKVFLDTSPLIYLLDSDVNFGDKTNKILSALAQDNNQFVSSVITCTEYLVAPYRTNVINLRNSNFAVAKSPVYFREKFLK